MATFDKRVKAVVAQVPAIISPEKRRAMNVESWDSVGEFLLKDRIERYRTRAVNYMKVVAPEGEPCVLAGQETYEEFMALVDPESTWRNQITLESLEKIHEFDPFSSIHLMAPAALLLIPAEKDSLLPIDTVKAAYQKAQEPKDIMVLSIQHFDIYRDPWLSKAADAAIAWFKKYL